MQIKETAFREETFFFELENKYDYHEILRLKTPDNFYDPPHPKIYYTCYLFDEIIQNEQKSQRGGVETVKYHTQKALVFSSFYHFFDAFCLLLKGIRNWSMKLKGFDLEQNLYSLVFNIPAPCPGYKKVCVKSVLVDLEFKLTPINQIPNSSTDVKMILKMKENTIFDILKFVILEVPVIFFGQDKFTLANIVKSFEELLFPFSYPFPVIEILPKVYYKSLEKLSCFLVGINEKFTNEFFEVNELNLNDKEYVVVSLSEEVPVYSYKRKKIDKYGILLKEFDKKIEKNNKVEKYSKNEVTFNKHYLTKSMSNLRKLFIGKNRTKKQINEIENTDVRHIFSYFFISLFQNYKSNLNLNSNQLSQYFKDVENNKIEINRIFNYKEFISKDMESIDFYSFFMNTKIFKNFLIKNLYPSTIEDKLGILLLDENISKKKNKYMKNLFKENTPFLETDIFNIKEGKEEKIKIPYETEGELQSMMGSKINKLNFPVLDEKKMENLFTKNFLKKEVKISNLYVEFYTKCFQILRDKKYLEGYKNIGYNINIVDEFKSNNEPYVIKLWILLVCYSFKHLYPEEKWIIFYELLNDIQINNSFKNNLIDPFLSDLLFSTFIKYGDKQMCSLLYKELNDCINIREDYIIFMKLHKKFFYNKDQYEETFPKNNVLKERNYNIFNLPQDNKMEIVLISPNPGCQMINLKPTLLNFSSQSDILTFKCPICQKMKEAKVTVSLGRGKKEDKCYQLYSAKYLYYFIKDIGDYDIQTFYKKYTEIFFNLIILFQLRALFYDFLFPYNNLKENIGFDKDKLTIKQTEKYEFVKKERNKDEPKWYDVIEEEKGREHVLKKLKPCKVTTVENFKLSEPINPDIFFKKYSKKIVKNSSRLINKKKIEK